ncbi:FtsW/RodA/SpoVE family cell cycle protein [Victivallis sp. Marseille-Q1083]|uniref:FtsW/RodA/SpoVE family cell cycle protein n=1 Tax=Victivallis sp. Marseille-Q1083 TaxID=2717288 RepID=UPI00158CD84D|nr:FtsW/RodA/SpoVE family cell cycle protein [Victivallis sp. Marseille-Q1083]
MSRPLSQYYRRTLLIEALTVLIGLWGCLTIYSTQSGGDDTWGFLSRQLCWLGLGFVTMFGLQQLKFRYILAALPWLAALTIAGLAGVLLFGVRLNGMLGWFSCGDFWLQPSEPLKAAVLLVLAGIFTATPLRFRQLAIATGFTGLVVGLLILQPDYGMALLYCGAFFLIAMLAGIHRHYLFAFLAALPVAALLAAWRSPYVWRRFAAFWNPDGDLLHSGWHIRQFQLAIARGGWTGTELGNAFWSNTYLPLAYNDSIFAAMAEAVGFFGVLPYLTAFAALIYLLWQLGMTAPDRTGRLFVVAAAGLLAIQALLHISINLALLPPTGLTLPLVSYGGSSMFGSCLLIGLALSAGRPAADVHNIKPCQ